MNESGLINHMLVKVIAEQGHQDLLMVVDAGFAIPVGIKTIDISLKEIFKTVKAIIRTGDFTAYGITG